MPFSLFKRKKKLGSEQERLKSALEICEEAIQYCESTILAEIRQVAKKTGNYDETSPLVNKFNEAYMLDRNCPYLLQQQSTIDLYKKRDVFLKLESILLGDDGKPKQTIKEANEKLNLPVNKATQDLIKRTPNDINAHEKRVAEEKENTSLSKHEIAIRFKLANDYININQNVINKARDTQATDGWFVSAIKKLGKLFMPSTKTSEKVEELKHVMPTM